jgi:hypothetical protein
MRNDSGNVVVRHPPLPGKDMSPPSADYAENMEPNRKSPAGGITGALGPYNNPTLAEQGEYQNG